MTLQNDFEALTGNKDRATLIVEDLFVKGRSRSEAYRKIASEARTLQLEVIRLSVLLLKYENERRRALGMADRTDDRSGTSWDAQAHFEAMAYCGDGKLVRTQADLTVLVAEILQLGLHQLPIKNDAIDYVAEQNRVTESQLNAVDSDTSDQYMKMKLKWLGQNIELRCVESNHSDVTQRAASVRQAFMAVFGTQFLAERAQFNRMHVAYRRLEMARENPGAGDVLSKQIQMRHDNYDGGHLGRRELDIRVANFTHMAPAIDSAVDGSSKAKLQLRRLALLTHPDKVRQANLTTKQRRKLAAIWHATTSLRARRINNSTLTSAVPFLERKLYLAERIMELSHIEDLNAEMVVQGETIDNRIQWLANENRVLIERIKILKAESGDLSVNQQLEYMRSLVHAPEGIRDAERNAMVQKCESHKQRAEALEREVTRVLASAA